MQQFVVVINVCLCRLGIAFHVGSLRLEEMAQLICSFYVPFIQYTMNHMNNILKLCSLSSVLEGKNVDCSCIHFASVGTMTMKSEFCKSNPTYNVRNQITSDWRLILCFRRNFKYFLFDSLYQHKVDSCRVQIECAWTPCSSSSRKITESSLMSRLNLSLVKW
ncbi:hypothetical protein H5410_020743 [Solanum commersonii]|uniref:Uncharacterized protein n=1 Tax=Solanum commersonii TaxID=4109 RepID=A0A9J5ZF51_SOLCO|nr:hypothetical protein H5410_020743 [Solanum commersonii]